MPKELIEALALEPNGRLNWEGFVKDHVKPTIEEAFRKRRQDICGEWACAAYLVNPKTQREAQRDDDPFIRESRQVFLVSISNVLQVQLI